MARILRVWDVRTRRQCCGPCRNENCALPGTGLMRSPPRPGIRWSIVLLLTSVGALNYCDRTAISAVFPLLRTDLQASDVGLAAIGSVFLWSYAIGSLFAGWLSDRVPRTTVIAVSLALWSAITVWTGMARSLTELLATRILLGLAESAYLPAAVAFLAD